ncbi:MAG: endonuclease/exonuclease/phosphatase family protein [Halioglobus sp.]
MSSTKLRPFFLAQPQLLLKMHICVAAAGISAILITFSSPVFSSPLEALACSAALGQPAFQSPPSLPVSNKPAPEEANRKTEGLSGPIRLLSWNIQKSQTSGWDTDLKKFGEDRDLLLIQEASIQAGISSALPQDLYQAFAAGYITDSQATGVATLSSVAPMLQCNLTAWEPWLGTPKATNITEYPLALSPLRLLVINLHAVNFTVGMEDFITQVEALTPLFNNHKGPLLIAGDFNTWSEARHTHLDNFMLSHQLVAVDFTPDHRTTFWNLPLDHMYLRGLRALESEVIPVETSDHNPLLVTVELTVQ